MVTRPHARSRTRSAILCGRAQHPIVGEYKTLSDIRRGNSRKMARLKVNDTALNNAIGNPTKLAAFFAATSTDPTAQGFAVRINNVASQLLGTHGSLQTPR